MNAVADRIARSIATDIGARADQVTATVALLDGGDTVPFVARYRKEATGGLDDTQLRRLAERLDYLRELEKQRASILAECRWGSFRRARRSLSQSNTSASTQPTRFGPSRTRNGKPPSCRM